MIQERKLNTASGWPMLGLLVVLIPLSIWGIVALARAGAWVLLVADCLALLLMLVALFGFFMVNPNQGAVLQLFGDYKGTEHRPGLRWANPLYSVRHVSLRVRNFETGKLKVNDNVGNPVEIAGIVVWKVIDTAEAVFEVDDFENYVRVQSEAALRSLASLYAYVAYDDELSLTANTAEISARLQVEIQDRLSRAGIQVTEARISHLAYAPEIAAAMLQRQQASAVVAARQKIVEGAVGMVETALEMLSAKGVVSLDEERRAAMVSNLLVVLCSDRHAQPVVNTGTLHH